jgi:hypothetical protein
MDEVSVPIQQKAGRAGHSNNNNKKREKYFAHDLPETESHHLVIILGHYNPDIISDDWPNPRG